MTVNALRLMMWAPVVCMFISYWALGNNQIYDNMVFKIANVKDLVRSGHTVVSEFQNLAFDQSLPCLLVFLALLFFIPFGSLFVAIVNLLKPGFMDITLNIDENLSNYFEALEEQDKQWMVEEE
jgi:hypothetical protein